MHLTILSSIQSDKLTAYRATLEERCFTPSAAIYPQLPRSLDTLTIRPKLGHRPRVAPGPNRRLSAMWREWC